MGESLEDELDAIVRKGLESSLSELTELRKLSVYHPDASSDTPGSRKQKMARLLNDALSAWEKDAPEYSKAMAILLALGVPHGRGRRLTGEGGLRHRAGKLFGVGHDQFYRNLETQIRIDFAEFLRSWDGAELAQQQPTKRFSFEDVKTAAEDMHRKIEQKFAPDVVITMSGPGSFAAFYVMRFNPRDVPVLTAVTFPLRESVVAEEKRFKEAAADAGWIHFATSKWSVYVPNVVQFLKKGAHITLFDDRVVTGVAQQELKSILTERGYRVSCAAVFGPSDVESRGVLIGYRVEGKFDMPWGPSSGRT